MSDVLLKARVQTKIKRNAARCKRCGEVIESKHVHDYVRCHCGAIAVDGGLDYLRRIGRVADAEDLSEYDILPEARPKAEAKSDLIRGWEC